MRAVLIAVATLLSVPALAQNKSTEAKAAPPPAQVRPPPPNGNPGTTGFPDTAGTPVVVERDALLLQLANINEKLATAAGRAKKDRQLQQMIDSARADLKEVGRQVTNAPLAQRPEPSRPPQPPPQPQPPTAQPITDAMLRSLVAAIRNEPFGDDQLAVLEEAASTQYFLVSQTQDILRHFNFSKDKLKALRLIRPHLLDMENSFKLYESFQYSNDKDELRRILAAQ
ncbi:DUF4476 domain-containing protein [Archangium violaceum]|uniref:DUF4476 domain-containing protein n=1 Tax=Archangium violaceum TaxID=83451 RepID=UPI0019501BFE|nr:DUF4476 domain-containing protein [Archangium violaceum]QRN98619.1 DUF4476 domain-containing protein [Archangium violaceum]